ncbi:OsmC family peroxiredoxin [Pelagibius litoralis]|uniref:OsmC family peroxiredoxin n=1 Tax=Pelagibius litoralis TaxID=374515 RepID=A0A967C423_9PROT|nr:OsmC family protein [Pelagibius litoralis]NIA68169.1 OsmC family peroxiredoxin [Pelagibius litoralis]
MPRGKDHHYTLQLTWTGAEAGPTRDYRVYSREYRVDFDGKPSMTGSADPAFKGDPKLHNPEELLLLALSSCHMLSYLALASLEGLVVTAYEDNASGTMVQEGRGGRFNKVTLRPKVTLAPGSDLARAETLHGDANRTCFIANSVNFPVGHEASVTTAG